MEYKTGTVTYLIVSASCKNAKETLDEKVENLIKKDVQETLYAGKEKSC